MIKLTDDTFIENGFFRSKNRLIGSLFPRGYEKYQLVHDSNGPVFEYDKFIYWQYSKEQIAEAIKYREGEPFCYINELWKEVLICGTQATSYRGDNLKHFNLAILANGDATIGQTLLNWLKGE